MDNGLYECDTEDVSNSGDICKQKKTCERVITFTVTARQKS
jgi:hypothetical protein